jgi:hypothetical protein
MAFFFLALAMNVHTVQADVALPSPPFGANPSPGADATQVQMVSEVVTFNVAASSLKDTGYARVSAVFQMHNNGSQAETMVARFPLCAYAVDQCIWSPEPSINDLAVWVNGVSAPVTPTDVSVHTMDASNKDIDIPGWGNFKVTFPSGEDVTIRVTYTAWGYKPDPVSGMVEYNYVLQTGAGWNGPIQQADVIFQLPFDINAKNLIEYYVSDTYNSWTISGHELRWHAENFKPENNVVIQILNPTLWQTIQTETQNTINHPTDGEAWGRLAMAYKKAVWESRGPRMDASGLDLIQASKEAYQNSVRLLPKDPEWHYGYAELLCYIAMWNMDDPAHLTPADPNMIGCIQQLKDTLDINPKDDRALNLLKTFNQPNSNMPSGIVDISGAKPDYLILTPQPSNTPTLIPSPTSVFTITATPPFPLPTIHFPPLPATSTPTQAITNLPASITPPSQPSTLVKTALPTLPAAVKNASQPLVPAVAGLVVLCGFIAFIWLRKGQPKP